MLLLLLFRLWVESLRGNEEEVLRLPLVQVALEDLGLPEKAKVNAGPQDFKIVMNVKY